ncbi:hypothetical protein D1AOALGA4SA_4153 [Olavius algarvensis Delta 1 endosymbiont]|nr:hypothetical protein D1AOALGA4SA_4153 [Olavius algarvensis Delta 1 endosymbiont]
MKLAKGENMFSMIYFLHVDTLARYADRLKLNEELINAAKR